MTRPIALVVLDGFGLAPDGPGQRRGAGAHAGLRRALGALPAHHADRIGARGRAARGPDGQLRGRAPQHRRRPHRRPGSGARRRRGRRRLAGAQSRASGGLRGGARRPRRAARGRARLRRRRALARRPPARDRGARRSPPACRASPCTPSRTAATSRRTRPPACSRSSRRSGPARARRSRPSSAATTPWIATTALERTELARAAMVDGVGERADSASAAVEASYAAGLTDEFVEPIVLGDAGLRIAQGDPLVFFNFRPDRARQICHALAPPLGLLVTMTRYDDTLAARVAFDDAPLARHARRRARGRGPAPAARRRDREVRARHVLLRRRSRAAPRRRGLGARPLAPRRPHLRPRARDVGCGRRAAASPSASATATRSPSSISRTPTWSGIPACCRR